MIYRMQSTKARFKNIERIGLEKDLFQDLYHQVLTMSWLKFFVIYVLIFILFNLIFGFFYWLDAGGISNSEGNFFKVFSFSVQTFSTIGYGFFAPIDVYTHSLVIIESLLAVLFTALLTGLAFAKFSRPTARIKFSNKVVITGYHGKPALMFRMANLRGNQIAEASVKAVLLVSEKSPEGHSMRMQKDIQFVRSTSSFFILSWSVFHIIDEKSPFYGLKEADFVAQNIEMSVSVIGHDETFSQSVHSSGIYQSDDFVFNQDFEDILYSKNGRTNSIDYTKFDLFKPKV